LSELSRFEVWKAAARLHTLPAAITPVLVGAGLAVNDDVFRWDAFLWTMIGALAIQIAANFANDASDARRGADTEDRLGPPRMVAVGLATERAMWMATAIALTVALVAGVFLTVIAGPWIPVIGVVSVLAMLGYVGGPVPYGYRGLGEVFVFLFFGLVATVGSRFVYDRTAPLDAWLLAIPVGFLVTAILVANNYRDLETDRASGKRTLAVIMGPRRTRLLFAFLVYGAFPLILLFGMAGWTPLGTLFAAIWAPFAVGPVSIVQSKTDGPNLIRALKLTARLHLLTGLSLAAGAAITL
jgi:1,4-dihydroxy-2-naphthoate polyprenyltransferase